jgi:hypothetical protein
LLNPGLKPWAQIWSPFREEICISSLMLTRMGGRRTEATNSFGLEISPTDAARLSQFKNSFRTN